MLSGLIEVLRTEGRPRMHRFSPRARRSASPAGTARTERGASALEYALLIAAIAAVLVAVVLGMASIVEDAFSGTSDCVAGRGTSSNCPSPSN